MRIKNKVKYIAKCAIRPFMPPKYCYGYRLFKHTIHINGKTIEGERTLNYFIRNRKKLGSVHLSDKANQICELFSCIDICPIDNETFFYSIDCFKTLEMKNHIFDNYSVDYAQIVDGSLLSVKNQYKKNNCEFAKGEVRVVEAIESYFERLKKDKSIAVKWNKSIAAIETLFHRPANSFYEALQRILFYNQFIWQTNHKNCGLGHLDWILQHLYEKDLSCGNITREQAKEYLKQFFLILHEYYWFKSSSLMGDTGQIIILGGLEFKDSYRCSDLTYLFIEVSKELKLPDPKVFLRCASIMPADLLESALDCISTGIGAPFLSNDDAVIPALCSAGYEEKDAYYYSTSACWEPLILGVSCDQNNAQIFNFAKPLVDMLNGNELEKINDVNSLIVQYKKYLSKYIEDLLTPMTEFQFEEDPVLSLLSTTALSMGKDITRGGVKYSNIGLTSVGLGAVVNSIMNVERLVFDEKKYSLDELNEKRNDNFADVSILKDLKEMDMFFGCDEKRVLDLTKDFMNFTEREFSKYHTKYAGKFKIGLSSPSYIAVAKNTPATLDGRKNGDPFSTHISSDRPLPVTELLSFASKLDYSGLKCNGNVVDFIVNPELLRDNIDKYCLVVKSAFAQGVFQMQMNVVSSKTLIAAREHPEQFPDLIVRVWGFSAYFKDLPDEYKDVLIQRAIESEKAA